jgi:hypothetical protein
MRRIVSSVICGSVWALLLSCGGGADAGKSIGAPTPTAAIDAPRIANPAQAGLRADYSPSGSGCTWTLSAGTITNGQGSSTIQFSLPSSLPSSGKITLTCQGPAGTANYDLPLVAPLGAPPAHGTYGPGVSGDALANTRVGGPYGTSVSCRFRASTTGTLTGFRKFLIWGSGNTGYNAGTGGTIRFQLWTDDGTSAHLPGTMISNAQVDSVAPPSNGGGYYPQLTFTTPPSVTAGTLYHLVITNVDADPVNNYVSVDDLWTDGALTPAQPTVADVDWALLQKSTSGSGSWVLRQCFLPTLELFYSNGNAQGRGWMEVWVSQPKRISGSAGVRERIAVGGGDKIVTAAYLRLKRVSGSSPLTLRLEDSGGTLIDSVAIPASQVQVAHHWVGGAFASARTLVNGQVYYLTMSAPSDTVYETFPIRDGAFPGFGDFQPTSTFGPNCWAEYTTGAGWTGWDDYSGAANRKDGDLQFYLVLQ